MFSARLPARLEPNELTQAVKRARAAGTVRFDLTTTNPTAVDLDYPPGIAEAFADSRNLVHAPEPLGLGATRALIGARTGVPADRVVLTASTSEAYAFLFKLLCDPGDAVLTPRPSYPLFDLLTSLEGIGQGDYRLDPTGGWCIDRDSLERALAATPRARAVLVVSPNNPTGSRLRKADRDWLVAWAGRHRLALISDEVFADYLLTDRAESASLAGEPRVLTFALGGLSKSAGLPQMKLAWTLVSGPTADVEQAIARLEIIADSYLSVSTPVQHAAERLLDLAPIVRERILDRLRRNLDALRALVREVPALTLYEPEGGWSAVLRMPATCPEDEWVRRLLDRHGVLVHPGYFFDIEQGTHIVVSLLPAQDTLKGGLAGVAAEVRGRQL